jgi:hypothetical protein
MPTPRVAFASLRTGTNIADWSVSFFVDNLFDSHTITNYNHQTNYLPGQDGGFTPAFRYITYRPRTFGITATMRR